MAAAVPVVPAPSAVGAMQDGMILGPAGMRRSSDWIPAFAAVTLHRGLAVFCVIQCRRWDDFSPSFRPFGAAQDWLQPESSH